MTKNLSNLLLLVLTSILAMACQQQAARVVSPLKPPEQQTEIRALPDDSSAQLKLVIDDAIDQVGKTTGYDPSYQKIEYPNGDVPIETGVCSDVIVRAFRKAGIDLQKYVHDDIITWDLGGGYDHIGMVTNVWYKPSQRYLIVHNIGNNGTHMDDSLFAWKI